MNNNKAIFFFEKINFFNLIFIILFKIFFIKNKFFYRYLPNQMDKKIFFKIFNLLKIENLNYKKVGYKNYVNDFVNECIKLTNPVIRKIKKDNNYKNIFNYYNLDEKNRDVLDIYLSKSLAGNYLTEGYTSLKLLEHTFGNSCKIFYFPEHLGNFLISKEKNQINIKPVITLILIKNLIKFFISLFNFKESSYKNNDKIKILFCPHKGLYYGSFFKKNFIFKNDYQKNFKNDEILVADHKHQCNISKRYYKRFNINEVNFNNFKKFNILNFINFIFKIFSLNFTNFYYVCFLIYNFNALQNSIKFLKKFKNLNSAIFCYDINTDLTLILACNILKIKTFSFQEKTNSYFFTPYMYFDEYYISGPKIKNIFSKNFYNFGNINIAPLSRTSLIKNNSSESYKKNIICLPPPKLDDKSRYMYGDIYSDVKINLFYDIILNLSKSFPDYTFMIKRKFLDENPLIEEFKSKIKKSKIENILILDHKKSLYKLIKDSQILFGSYSSIFDECFSVDKKILIYDKDFDVFNHPFKSTSLYCENFLDSKRKIELILQDKFIHDPKINEIKNGYFLNFDNQNNNVYSDIISKINDIILK